MRVAIIGCGFVADFYMETLVHHDCIELAAICDADSDRAQKFSMYHRLACPIASLDVILNDPTIRLIINLTNPRDHYEITKASLLAGKHVYSEKPIAMYFAQAQELNDLANKQKLFLVCAPCNVLSESAQTAWQQLRNGAIGDVKLAYAEMDDGMVFKMPYEKWISASGKQWPYKDEFEIGCTLEHAGYYVNWLTAFFGPATSVSAFAECLYPGKESPVALDNDAPDYSSANILFQSGVVGRLTCSIIAPRDRKLRIFGTSGNLQIDDCWQYRSPVLISKMFKFRRGVYWSPVAKKPKLLKFDGPAKYTKGAHPMDFCRGIVDLIRAIDKKHSPTMTNDYCLHNNEIVLAIHHSASHGGTYKLQSTFSSLTPPAWTN